LNKLFHTINKCINVYDILQLYEKNDFAEISKNLAIQ